MLNKIKNILIVCGVPIVVSLLILGLFFSVVNYRLQEVRIEKKLQKNAVVVYSKIGSIGYSCSGIVVKETENNTAILTADHCAVPRADIFIDFENEVHTVIKSQTVDLALLVIKGNLEGKDPVKIAKNNPKLFSNIYTLGYPSYAYKYTIGEILVLGNTLMYTTAKVIPGCSGSGVVNANGDLTGILSSGYFKTKKKKEAIVSCFVNLKNVKRFLGIR